MAKEKLPFQENKHSDMFTKHKNLLKRESKTRLAMVYGCLSEGRYI